MPVDIGGLDPLTVSLRDYVDGSNTAHDDTHAREREAHASLLDAHDKYGKTVIEDHFRTHEKEHEAFKVALEMRAALLKDYKTDHIAEHEKDRLAVKTALDSVDRLQAVHAEAHAREHHSHEVVHQREREGAALARDDLNQRLAEIDNYRAQIREEASSFMPRTEINALLDRVNVAVEAQSKAAESAHNRMDANAAERVASLQMQIDKLNIANASNSGASQRTTLLIGASFTFVTIIIALVGIFLSNQGV